MEQEQRSVKTRTTRSETKPYQTPTLTIYGSVEEITQATVNPGTGDWFVKLINDETPIVIPDILS